MTSHPILISGNAPALYPADTFFAVLYYGPDDALEVPKLYPYCGEWGKVLSTSLPADDHDVMPYRIDMVWLSITERIFYSLEKPLPAEKLEHLWSLTESGNSNPLFDYLIVGMAPFGGVALWAHGSNKSTLVEWMQAERIEVKMSDFIPTNPDITLDQNCDYYINSDPLVRKNLAENGLPPRDLFNKFMQQFTYRYKIDFGHWNEKEKAWSEYELDEDMPELDYIEEALFDGTHDKLHDGGLMHYHEAGKPQKLTMKWHIGKKEWTAYFWFEDAAIRAVFDRFYGPRPDTEADFAIKADPELGKYELALCNDRLGKNLAVGKTVYQLLVFKNQFESFRSENYSQERGAWVW